MQWAITGALHVRPLMLVAGLSLLTGIQLGSLGLLGEMFNSRLKPSGLPVAGVIRPKGV